MALRLRPACQCACEDGTVEVIPAGTDGERLQVDGIFWHKCACTKCGPPGRGCDITISFVAIEVFAAMTGKEMPSSLLDARNHPGYCDDCRDHILLERRKEDVIRARETLARGAGHVPEAFEAETIRILQELEAEHERKGSLDGRGDHNLLDLQNQLDILRARIKRAE